MFITFNGETMSKDAVKIIAEIGINHNGDINIAKQLIDAAKWCGCDMVKFQKRTIDKVYTPNELDKPRESPWGSTNRQQKLGLEFGKDQYDEIDAYCKRVGIQWFASPWDLDSVDFLEQYNPHYYKIPSALLNHMDLLEKIAKFGDKKYTFISTGMSTIEEITKAVLVFKKYNAPYELMHCNSAYPANDEDLNLDVITYLRKLFCCKVGYSCHSPSIMFAPMAVALGATSIEKHITLNRTMYGSDQAASVEVVGFYKLVDYIRSAEKALGNGVKTITPQEQSCRNKLWRTTDY